jgi:hypothetical protein
MLPTSSISQNGRSFILVRAYGRPMEDPLTVPLGLKFRNVLVFNKKGDPEN